MLTIRGGYRGTCTDTRQTRRQRWDIGFDYYYLCSPYWCGMWKSGDNIIIVQIWCVHDNKYPRANGVEFADCGLFIPKVSSIAFDDTFDASIFLTVVIHIAFCNAPYSSAETRKALPRRTRIGNSIRRSFVPVCDR